jgi:hypothetical protein
MSDPENLPFLLASCASNSCCSFRVGAIARIALSQVPGCAELRRNKSLGWRTLKNACRRAIWSK